MLKISLLCRPHLLPDGDITRFTETARLADLAGLYSIHFGEHVLVGDRTDRYPFGPFPHAPETAWPDPLVLLAAAAAVTSSLRLSTGVLLAPLRSGPMLAKQLATLDVLSRGRLEPGIGVGWQREEFAASGIDWDTRYAMFDANIRMCRQLWGPQPVRLTLPDGSFQEVHSFPVPTQERLPLLLGLAATPNNVARIVEYGDGWSPVRLTPPQLADGVQRIRAAFSEAGRDPDSLIVRTQAPVVLAADGRIDVPATLEVGADYEAAGATILTVGPNHPMTSMRDVETLVTELAAATLLGSGATG